MAQLVPVRDAAEMLQVTPSHVHRLLDSGQLRGRTLGSQRVVFAPSLHEYRLVRPERGRPLEPASAWSLLLRSEPKSIDELGPLAAATRRRAHTTYCHVLPFRLEEISGSTEVVASGPLGASRQGAHIGATEPLHIYVKDSDWAATRHGYSIDEAGDDLNVIVRVVPTNAWPFSPGERTADLIVCAVDSYAAADLRSAHEALDRMRQN